MSAFFSRLWICIGLSALALTAFGQKRSDPIGVKVPMPGHHQLVCDWDKDPGCLFSLNPIILSQKDNEIHLAWDFIDTAILWQEKGPELMPLQDYKESIRKAISHEKLTTILKDQRPDQQTSKQPRPAEPSNPEIVKHGIAGAVRPINCLESHLLAYQTSRFDLFEQPTEFHGFILKGQVDDIPLVRVYFVASDQPFPPKPVLVIQHIELLIEAGWQLYGHLHNHYAPAEEFYVGAAAPSQADVHYYKVLVNRFDLQFAFVTNGFQTVEIKAAELGIFNSH